MAKKIVEDVIPPRRSIRNIPLSGEKASKVSSKSASGGPKEASKIRKSTTTAIPDPAPNKESPRKVQDIQPVFKDAESVEGATAVPKFPPNKKSRLVVWGGAVVLLAAVAYLSSSLFVRASVTVTPKEWSTSISTNLEAAKDSTTLGFSLITVSAEASKNVKANGEEKVEKKASGSITIFNNNSSGQALVKNTRFESPKGLIFRIQESVTVPGKKTQGATTLPGSVTVKVVADKAGPEYNIGLSDFTIPGFKGDPRYQTITAKSASASPIQGGFIGTVKKVNESDLQTANISMERELRDALAARILAEVPADHVFFKDGAIISFQDISDEDNGGGSSTSTVATVRKKATITGTLFDQRELIKSMASSLPENIDSNTVSVKSWSGLDFTFKNNSDSRVLSGGPIQFSLEGTVDLVPLIHADIVSQILAGKKKKDFKQVISGYPDIETAELKTYPVWARTLPKSPDRIEVHILTK